MLLTCSPAIRRFAGDALPEEPEQLEEQGELVEVDDDDDEEEGESRPEDSVPDVDEDEVIQEEPSSTQSRPSTSAARQSEAAPSGRPAVAEGRTRLLSARHMAPFSFPQVGRSFCPINSFCELFVSLQKVRSTRASEKIFSVRRIAKCAARIIRVSGQGA